MKAPAESRRAQDRGNPERSRRATSCPWPCLGHHGELVDRAGTVRATWCSICDQAITRGQWAVELERAAAA